MVTFLGVIAAIEIVWTVVVYNRLVRLRNQVRAGWSDVDVQLTRRHDLVRIRAAGIRVAIDDFGTGYSSLSHLQRLPIDRLKIDRAFITGLTQRSEDQVIAAMIINMGHLLHLRVIAEGVETEAQQKQLVDMGCDDAQGYLYGKPLSAEALLAMAKSQA